jgi:ankyrin repeat protein
MKEWFEAAGSTPDVTTLERLLDEHKGKLDVNATDEHGYTALGWAAQRGNADVVEFLLCRGADVNKHNSKYPSLRPLWWAAYHGHAKAVITLIAGGAKVNEAKDYDADRPTALHAAAYHGRAAVVRLLLQCDADAGIRNKKGLTAADLAAERKENSVVAVFKEFASKSSATGRSASPRSLVIVVHRSRFCCCQTPRPR